MKTLIFMALPKKTKSVECTNFKTINLMSSVTKILFIVVNEGVRNKINKEISGQHFGF